MDRERIETFMERFLGIASGATTLGLLAIADRTGLLRSMADHGSMTSETLAEAARLDERYVREILSGLAAAGVVEYEADTRLFTLPPEHAVFVVDETSPYFMGGYFDMIPASMEKLDEITAAARYGGGVAFDDFGPRMVTGLDRGNAPSQRIFLVRKWLPAVPGLIQYLESGIRVADIGCGSGTAAILIAEAFPESQVEGYDVAEESLKLARARSAHLDNVAFHSAGAGEVPVDPGFDLITTFDVIHDLVDPLGGLRRIREALRPGGRYLMMEPNASSSLEDNLDDRGALLYGLSTLHCMTQSLASGGAGLGAAWGEDRAREMTEAAGFTGFERLADISNRFSAFYLLTV